MRITEITAERITFDNGNTLTYYHEPYCCEENYALFEYLNDEPGIKDFNFDEDLQFETVQGSGFRFGDARRMFFVPCYSDQNGCYSDLLDIYYKNANGEDIKRFDLECQEIEFGCDTDGQAVGRGVWTE